MENKEILFISNFTYYPIFPGTVFISSEEDYLSNKTYIQESINNFNSEIEWSNMWTFDKGLKRIKKPFSKLCLLVLEGKVYGHVWYDEKRLFNCYISKNRPDNISVDWLKGTFNVVRETYIELLVDDWNIRAKKFYEKVGFTSNISDI